MGSLFINPPLQLNAMDMNDDDDFKSGDKVICILIVSTAIMIFAITYYLLKLYWII